MTIAHQGFMVGTGDWPGRCTAPDHPADRDRDFIGRAPGMDRCHSCWYGGSMRDANERFAPLTDLLTAAGVTDWYVDQTGGMVMCLRIELESDRFILVPELDEVEELGAGIYEGEDDDGETIYPEGDLAAFAQQLIHHIKDGR